jgi:hypothetical protein
VFPGGLENKISRRLGKPAAIAGVAIAILGGPTHERFAPRLDLAARVPFDVVKGSAQLAKKKEENLEALDGDPDGLRSSGEPLVGHRVHFVDPSSVEDNSENWKHIPDYSVPESEAVQAAEDDPQATADPEKRSAESRGESTGEHRVEAQELNRVAQTGEALRERWPEGEAQRERWQAPVADAGGAAEPQPERPRAPIATPPAAAERRLAPRMPRMPEVAPVAPSKLGAMPAGPLKRGVVPVPVRLLAPKPEVASAVVALVAPKVWVASPSVSLVVPKPEGASPSVPLVAPNTEAASPPEPDPAPERVYRPWLADAAESEPVEQEPER